LTNGYISATDWDTLTREEREHVYHLREERDRSPQYEASNASNEHEHINENGNENYRRESETSGRGGARDETPSGRGIGATMTRRNFGGRGDPSR
jgi:hypothetical protein